MRALKALKQSPMQLDVYMWLTYRMSYLKKPTVIPWPSLQDQFGAEYAPTPRGLRDFRANFLKALKAVIEVYPMAKATEAATGLRLAPSLTHIPKRSDQIIV